MSTSNPRWREPIEVGLWRHHETACRSSVDRKPGRRCACAYSFKAPGAEPGTTRTVTLRGNRAAALEERALLRRAEVVADLRASPEPPAETLKGLVTSVFRARASRWAANTIRNREDDYLLRIEPAMGELPVDQITRELVEVWLADLIRSGASHRAVVQTVATLRVFLGVAVEWGRITENPARRLRLPRRDPADVPPAERVLDRGQLERLFEAAGTAGTETMLRAAGEAGLRRGEIAGLRWGDVNLPAERFDVRRQVVQERLGTGKGHRKVVTAPKGGRSRRVALSQAMVERLADWYAESVVEGGADAQGYVWPGMGAEPMHDRSLARALERACRRVGFGETYIAQTKKGPQERFRALVSPHRLRHSAASAMLLDRVPLTVVAAQLGHADVAITARIYAHLTSDQDLDLAAAVFNRRSGDPVPETVPDDADLAEIP